MTRQDHRGTLAGIAVVVAGLLAGLAMTQDGPHASAAVTREGLLAVFESDIRRVYRWDPGDPRPEDERQRALFEFVYQTYDSSAWIPQSLFDTNLVTQVVVGDVETIVRDKAGLVLWRDNRAGPGVRHGAQHRRRRAAAMDGQLPDLSHGRDRRHRLFRRRHQDVRRHVAR